MIFQSESLSKKCYLIGEALFIQYTLNQECSFLGERVSVFGNAIIKANNANEPY
jgi:hypothetical protein